ncbi:trans-sialidase [Trypanosoma rangeli]|uniref:Trans-sialidase n=1 Tax=Trypanosoma rangeli TaxID=5698 RepID=A0A422MTB4_TRYRA|nr:trans-sialidase [Trypanosoma rangeli]RNE96466.1 trans-sialidase [Trypanosoma rangeli]|eukprot:RNE96466.1 trans-sialidase [Trypanosoma rangeli]
MLLTTPVYSKEKGKDQLHLWVTDNARVHDVGPVSREGDDAAASSLLYRKKEKEELIVLYENKKNDLDDSFSLAAVRLTDKLLRIKEVVKTWKDMDAALKSCTSSDTVDPRAKGMCEGPIPIKGLVGLLSNALTDGTETGKVWRDEYLGVNATVKNGAAGEKWGVRFEGAGAGAEWPVGSNGQNQPYYFANNKFALVTTVVINAVPEDGDNPIFLLGARMNDKAGTVLFGLSYTREKKWRFQLGRRVINGCGDVNWEPNKVSQVVVEMRINDWYVHVDGKEICSTTYGGPLFNSYRISHFLLGGGNGTAGSSASHDVTVASVLLYNKLLDSEEIKELNANKVTFPKPAGEEPNSDEEGSSGPADDPEKMGSKPQSNDELDREGHSNTDQDAAGTNDDGDAASHAPDNLPSVPTAQPPTPEGQQPEDDASDKSAGEDEGPRRSEGDGEVDGDRAMDAAEASSEDEVPEGVVEEEEEKEGLPAGAELGSPVPSSSKVSADADGPDDADVDAIEKLPSQHEVDENQAQQSSPPAIEDEDVPSNETKAGSEERVLGLEAEGAGPGAAVGSGGSPASRSDPEEAPAKETPETSLPGAVGVHVEDNEEMLQGADNEPANQTASSEPQAAPPTRNTTPLAGNTLAAFKKITGVRFDEGNSDNAVGGCVPHVVLLALLGLWGIAVLSAA